MSARFIVLSSCLVLVAASHGTAPYLPSGGGQATSSGVGSLSIPAVGTIGTTGVRPVAGPSVVTSSAGHHGRRPVIGLPAPVQHGSPSRRPAQVQAGSPSRSPVIGLPAPVQHGSPLRRPALVQSGSVSRSPVIGLPAPGQHGYGSKRPVGVHGGASTRPVIGAAVPIRAPSSSGRLVAGHSAPVSSGSVYHRQRLQKTNAPY